MSTATAAVDLNRRRVRPQAPTLRRERALLGAGARVVVGMDEVGRGALAGPVSVGVVAVDATTRTCPRGVADSKLLSPAARTALLPALSRWGLARAVGHASAAEIDAVGIIAALRLAGGRALARLAEVIGSVDTVLLDGSHDWLTAPAVARRLVPAEVVRVADRLPDDASFAAYPVVHLLIKADRRCASVAAASVIAKCERDALMMELAPRYPAYRWDQNKGYGSADHLAALRTHGPSPLHRLSWQLPPQRWSMMGG